VICSNSGKVLFRYDIQSVCELSKRELGEFCHLMPKWPKVEARRAEIRSGVLGGVWGSAESSPSRERLNGEH